MGEQITDFSNEALLEQLKTIEGAQNLVNQALSQIKGTRRGDDDYELTIPEHEKAWNLLKFVLSNLPPETACISISATFPKSKEENPPSGLKSELRQLTRLIEEINPGTGANETIRYEFVVLPPSIPEEAKKIAGPNRFGSDVRSAVALITETLSHGRWKGINTLNVKPHGCPDEQAGTQANFRVPIRFVEAISLLKERKPLTPWIETKGGDLEINPVEYPS